MARKWLSLLTRKKTVVGEKKNKTTLMAMSIQTVLFLDVQLDWQVRFEWVKMCAWNVWKEACHWSSETSYAVMQYFHPVKHKLDSVNYLNQTN